MLVWLLLRPVLVWRTTHYVFTDQRILLQVGVFNRDRHDIPLSRVNDHSMNQHFVERLLGSGTLVIESAGERGQQVLRDIPQVEKVQTLLYELVRPTTTAAPSTRARCATSCASTARPSTDGAETV